MKFTVLWNSSVTLIQELHKEFAIASPAQHEGTKLVREKLKLTASPHTSKDR